VGGQARVHCGIAFGMLVPIFMKSLYNISSKESLLYGCKNNKFSIIIIL